ncbi:MAG: hypothetical protein AB1638_08490, partial [Nitrospirota bacterium]
NINTALCEQCHGGKLDGGIALISCFSCHNGSGGSIGHPSGWLNAKDEPISFHGTYGSNFVSGCTTCHGVDLTGIIGPSCFSCHNGVIAPPLERLP